ncbi:MAG: hypothetical protein ISS58_08250, partial [Dehalococcoidales bacterium]|nr:hypothetical protein [Dehalococcoidales bacterium]
AYDAANHAIATQAYADLVIEDAKALEFFVSYPSLEVVTLPDKLQQQLYVIADDLYKKTSAEDPFFDEVYKNQEEFKKIWKLFEQYQSPKL